MQRDKWTGRRADRPGEATCRFSQFCEGDKQLAEPKDKCSSWEPNYRETSQEILPPSSKIVSLNCLKQPYNYSCPDTRISSPYRHIISLRNPLFNIILPSMSKPSSWRLLSRIYDKNSHTCYTLRPAFFCII